MGRILLPQPKQLITPSNVVWEPSPKQSEFLSCPDYEVLYGGAAGGGKSDALLIDLWCAQDGGPTNPNHRAICFRRSFPELKDLIARSREIFPRFIRGVKYDNNDHMWRAPSGATFEFGYLQNDLDRFKYRGRAWNAIGFDELTLWATDVCYMYLMSRNRRVDMTLPRYMRATTNPDGPGQKWVMERWGIPVSGAASRIEHEIEYEEPIPGGDPYSDSGYQFVVRKIARTFIPAKLTDNKYLRGTGYRETLMQLGKDEQDQLLHGRWVGNNVAGAWYINQMQAMRSSMRIGRVPPVPGAATNTFWDLGKNDTTAIWLHQQVGAENRFIMCFESSGEYLNYYVNHLQTIGSDWNLTWGIHHLPHDGEHDRIQGPAPVDQLDTMWPKQRWEIVPRIGRVIDGISRTRAAMAGAYIDETHCADGIAALDLYRKKFDKRLGVFTHEPEHDHASNYADAFRQWGQHWHGARRYAAAADPNWKQKLLASKGRARNPRTA